MIDDLPAGNRLHPRGAQPLADLVRQVGIAGGEPRGHPAAELRLEFGRRGGNRFVHSEIPLALSALLKAWTAREQWVLTLPSEHPMAAAVSATSISSQ